MKKIISILLAVSMCLSLVTVSFAAGMNFADVKESDWFYGDVKSAVEMGLVNGKSESAYAPADNLTYAEAIKLAACMNQLYLEGSINFSIGDPWYMPYVEYCVDKGIIDKEYSYTENATRAGYMGIFANALPDEGLKAINNVPDDSIPDVPSSRAYAKGVYKLYRAGILTGVDAAHNCNPLANITRAEVAAILTRMMNETKRVAITDLAKEEEKKEEKKEETKPEDEKKEEEKKEETKPEDEKKEEENKEEAKALSIKTQPESQSTAIKKSVTFAVEAQGGKEPYKYQWQIVKDGNWSDIGTSAFYQGVQTNKFKALSTGVCEETIRCVVTDADGTSVITDEVKFIVTETVEEVKLGVVIKNGVEEVSFKKGYTLTIDAKITGGKEPYAYQWKLSKDGATWADDAKTSTFNATEAHHNNTVKLEITDADGQVATSNEIKITVEGVTESENTSSGGGVKDKFQQGETEELKNEDFEMTINQVVVVTGKGIVLAGYISAGKVNVGDTVYVNDADNVRIAQTTVKGIEMFNKSLDEAEKGDNAGILVDLDVDTYRSKIVAGNILSASGGSLGTRPSTGSRPSTVTRPTVTTTEPLAIEQQTQSFTAKANNIATLEISVSGGTAPYSYAWKVYKRIGAKYSTNATELVDVEGTVKGSKTSILQIVHTATGTYKYVCEITDANGNTVTSESIVVTCNEVATEGRSTIPTSGKSDYLQ